MAFGLTHKPQHRHVQKSAPRPHDPMVGKPPQPANADIAEMEHKSETASKVRARTGEEPEELERKVRVSRNVEEHELENVLRSLPQHGEKMKELLLQLFNLEDPETAAHLPYRDWCEHCVKSKGRQSHAVKKKNDRQPVIQIDFSFMATENDLPKRTILNATDVQTGYSMAVVLPSKGSVEKYAVAELRKFVFAIGRTFGIVQYDKEAPLKTMARDLCKVVGGMSMRSAPTGHSQSQGSVGNAQRTLYGQLRTLLSQVEVSTGVKVSSESPLFTWSVKHAQWLINRYMIGADGKTAYSRRWNREYNGSLCMFGELIDAKVPVSGRVRVPKAGSQWFSGVYLGIRILRPMKLCLGMPMVFSRSGLWREDLLLNNGMHRMSYK